MCVCLCVCAHTYLFEYVHVFSFCVLCFRYINERENTVVMEGCVLMNKSPPVMCSAKKKYIYICQYLFVRNRISSVSASVKGVCPVKVLYFALYLLCFFVYCCCFCFVVVVVFVFGVIEGIFHKLAKVTFVFFILKRLE